MGTIDATTTTGTIPASHVPADCFGERGMAHVVGRPHRLPIAAGLFGLPNRHAPRPSNDGGPASGRMMSAA